MSEREPESVRPPRTGTLALRARSPLQYDCLDPGECEFGRQHHPGRPSSDDHDGMLGFMEQGFGSRFLCCRGHGVRPIRRGSSFVASSGPYETATSLGSRSLLAGAPPAKVSSDLRVYWEVRANWAELFRTLADLLRIDVEQDKSHSFNEPAALPTGSGRCMRQG